MIMFQFKETSCLESSLADFIKFPFVSALLLFYLSPRLQFSSVSDLKQNMTYCSDLLFQKRVVMILPELPQGLRVLIICLCCPGCK